MAISDYLTKPVERDKVLISRRRVGVLSASPGSILVIDDDPSSLN